VIYSVISFISSLILDTISALGYFGVFLLMLLESAAIPAPSEIIMPFSGFLITTGRFDFWLVVLAGTLGNLIGSWLLYWIGLKGGRPFVARYGKYIFFSEADLATAEKWFEKYGSFSVFVGRLLPIVRTYISFPAGLVKMDFKKFTFYTVIGAAPWVFLFTWLGVKLGERWHEFEKYFRQFDIVIALVILAAVVWHIRRHYSNKKVLV
jgi:membrane protein DedA with SNARE-associated domain